MAEVVLASEAGNDGSLISEPQDCIYTERNDSVIDPLPTEGYRIFDVRPKSELPPNLVSRSVLFAVLDPKLTTMLHRHATHPKTCTHPSLRCHLTTPKPRTDSNLLQQPQGSQPNTGVV
jgi:hypothetical protein